MRRRHILTLLLLLAVLASALAAASAGAAGHAAVQRATAGQRAASPARYGKDAVIRAFRSAGIRLIDTGYGTLQPVTALAGIKPYAGQSIAVYVYLTASMATQSFNANAREWRASGFAVAQAKNVVVTVVPKGRILGIKAPPLALPAIVGKGLASLTH
jgi:hypothetical protein